MKKFIIMSVAVILLITLFTGCNCIETKPLPNNAGDLTDTLDYNGNTEPKLIDTNDPSDTNDRTDIGDESSGVTYTLLLYENTLSGLDDTVTKRASDRILENERIKETSEVPNKAGVLFGNTYVFNYDETLRSKTWLNNRLDYRVRDSKTNESLGFASFDSKTGELMYYSNVSAGTDRTYQSEVNDKSSEAEFLEYAKKLVSQYASVDGCEVEISTNLYEYVEEDDFYALRRSFDGYVNNTENVSDFYAIHQFKFYKMIDGIKRFDTNVIEIHSTGEVHRLWFNMQDELYADFANVKIDMQQAEEANQRSFGKIIPYDSTVEIVPSLVATSDGNLWLHLETFVKFDGGTSGYIYVIELSDTAEG